VICSELQRASFDGRQTCTGTFTFKTSDINEDTDEEITGTAHELLSIDGHYARKSTSKSFCERLAVFHSEQISPECRSLPIGSFVLFGLIGTHELRHARCNERNEKKADAYGEEPRKGHAVQCN
jgi:hypothetical protein